MHILRDPKCSSHLNRFFSPSLCPEGTAASLLNRPCHSNFPSFFIQLAQLWPVRSCQDQLSPNLCAPKTADQYLSYLNISISPFSSRSHVIVILSTVGQESKFLLPFLWPPFEADFLLSLRLIVPFPLCKGLPGTCPACTNPFDRGAVFLSLLVG